MDAPQDQNQNRNDVPYKFAERVLTVSLPTALMLMILVLGGEVEIMTALTGFAMVVCLTIVLALPFLKNLQNLTQYVHRIAQEEDVSDVPAFSKKDEESVRIIAAINQMRNIWATRTEQLTAQTLSDAAVLDSLPDPLLMLDGEGCVIGANLAARQLFGFNVRGRLLRDLTDSTELRTSADLVLQEGVIKKTLEINLNQKVFNAKLERLPAEAKAGAVAVLTLFDMTERKLFEQMQADFIANASHELRTPLSVLSGFIETLQSTAKEDEAAREKFLSIMQNQAGRMSALIESLLCLSRLQINESEKVSERVNVPEILPAVKQMLDAKAEKNGMKIVLKTCAQTGAVYGNAGELTQVFQNLVDNALKYGKAGGTVTVSCRVTDNADAPDIKSPAAYVVAVHNTGDPIAAESLPHLFERFYRVAATKGRAVGTGLGLSIVQQIVKHHNGTVTVESSKEAGTVFTVRLPMRIEDGGSESTKSPDSADLKTP